MSADLSRRGFLGGVLATGAVLSLAVSVGCSDKQALRIEHAKRTGRLVANMYITVMPDGRIALLLGKAEIGQGVATGYATLAAEELNVPLDRVDPAFAESDPEYRTSFNMHVTGGSTSTKEGFIAIRKAAASAREMLVAAAATAWRVPHGECNTRDGRVVHAASSREMTYGELTKLAARQPVPSSPRLKAAKDFSLIGKAGRRIDARGKVDGTATFGIDVSVPGMVNAYVLHPPQYGARVKSLDAAAARRRPGVIDIFAFDAGVAIVAAKYWQALAASRDVRVTWERGATAGLDSAVLAKAMHDHDGTGAELRDDGDAGDAIDDAKRKLRAVYEAPYLAHATMEPQNCTAQVTGSRAEIWAPTQAPTVVQAFVSDALGIALDDVRVHTTLSGGGFGRRLVADVCAQAAVIARRVKRPVKLVWSREADMTQAFYRPIYAIQMAGALRDDGTPSALRAEVISQAIAASSRESLEAAMAGIPRGLQQMFIDTLLGVFSSGSAGDLFSAEGLKDTPYQIRNINVTASPVTTKLPVASWRSVGHSVTGFAAESFIDELAHLAKADPLAFRRSIVGARSRQARVLDALAKLSRWGTPLPPGVARGVARHLSFESEVGEVAEVEIVDGRIRVRRVYCVVDCGTAVNPDIVRAQIEGGVIFGLSAALDQEITIVDGVVQQRNFDTFPLLRMFEAPEVIVEILPIERHPSGVGEPGVPPIAAAVGNAIFALTGVRLRRMPLQRAWNERGAK